MAGLLACAPGAADQRLCSTPNSVRLNQPLNVQVVRFPCVVKLRVRTVLSPELNRKLCSISYPPADALKKEGKISITQFLPSSSQSQEWCCLGGRTEGCRKSCGGGVRPTWELTFG